MKIIVLIILIVASGVGGFVVEPKLRPYITSSPKGGAASALNSVNLYPDINPATVPAAELPQQLLLTNDVKFNDDVNKIKLTIAAGSRVKLVSVSGNDVQVKLSDEIYRIALPYASTDLLKRLAEMKKNQQMRPEPLPDPTAPPDANTPPAPPEPGKISPLPGAEGDAVPPLNKDELNGDLKEVDKSASDAADKDQTSPAKSSKKTSSKKKHR